jgi:hypothetical protein
MQSYFNLMSYIRIAIFTPMKYILSFLIVVFFSQLNLNAQCTPDQTMVVPGVSPTRLADATVGEPYSQVISLLVPKDSVLEIGGTMYNVTVDSAVVLSIENYPPGFTYETNSPNMTWAGGERGCARIFGVATEKDVKTWAILVKVYTYFKIKGLSNQLEKLDQSTIDFKVVMPSGMNQIAAFKLQAFPNPANQEIEFTLPQNHTIQSVKLTNILGETKTVSNPIKYQDKQCVLNLQSIAEGAYFVELYSDKGIRFQSKFIKISN